MAVAQPSFLMDMNETGTASNVTNYGFVSTPYARAGGTHYAWHQNAASAPYIGYIALSENASGSDAQMAYFSTAATAPSISLTTINAAVAFNITNINSALGATHFIAPSGSVRNGDLNIRAQNKSGSNFDLYVQYQHNGSAGVSTTFAGLTFGTLYTVATSIDVSSAGAIVAKASLNGAAAVTLSSAGDDGLSTNWTGQEWNAAWPYMGRRNDFNNYGGIIGNVYMLCYDRRSNTSGVWSGSDLAAISAPNPAFIGGWPASDTTAPTYGSSPAVSGTPTTTTASFTATASDETDATVAHYMVVVADGASAPSAAQIAAGQNASGSAALAAASNASVANGVAWTPTISSGISSGTAYDAYFTAKDSSGNYITPVKVDFNTLSALSSAAGAMDATTGTTGNTASGSVSVTGPSGTLYWFLSNSATPPSVVNLKAGAGSLDFGNQAVSSSGTQNVANKGSLAEKTNYYFHYLHTYASQDSAIATSSAFQATDAPTLSSATGAVTGASTADLTVSTNRTAGTLYVVVTTSVTKPTATQIKAGQNAAGTAAAFAASNSSITSPVTFNATGLTTVGYYAHFYQEDSQGDGSNIITSNSFTPAPSGEYNIDGFTPGTLRPGLTATANLSGNWSGVSMTATINGHPVTLTAQSATQVQFTVPTYHTDPTFSDSPYGQTLVFLLNDGANNQTKSITVQPPTGYDFVTIAAVSGIWSDDSGAEINDSHLGHWVTGTGDAISTSGVLGNISGYPAEYEYWRFDFSENVWTANASETFYEIVAFDGPDYDPEVGYVGVALSAPIDGSAGFNAATANITAYAEVGDAVSGLTLNTSDGSLDGTPDTAGIYSYIWQATDSDSNVAYSNATVITVYDVPAWSVTPSDFTFLDGGSVEIPLAGYINADGLGPAESWSQLAGTLPLTLALDTDTGVISGTLDADASQSSPYNGQQFRATNTAGSDDSGTFNIIVDPTAPVFTGTIADITGLTGGSAMTPVDVTSYFGTYIDSYAFVGSPPAGITIDSGTGVISGTPTTFGTFSVVVRATNVTGTADSNSFNIVAADTISFTGNIADIGPLTINVPMSPVDVSGEFGGASATGYAFVGTVPPTGIVINSAGVISGTPTVAGTKSGVMVRKTSTGGNVTSNAFAISVVGNTPTQLSTIPDRSNYDTDDVGSVDFTTYFSGATSVAVTGLPDGLTDTAGVVTGTVSVVDDFTVTVTATNAFGNTVTTFTWHVLDLVPTLTEPKVYPKATTAIVRSKTDRSGGTWYWVVTTSATPPSAAQIQAGTDEADAPAVDAGNHAVTYIGEQSDDVVGLTALTTYYAYTVHAGAGGVGDSNVTSKVFATNSGSSGGGGWFDF